MTKRIAAPIKKRINGLRKPDLIETSLARSTTKTAAPKNSEIIDKVAQQTLDAPGGGHLLICGDTVTLKVFQAAEYLEILDELYWAIGESPPSIAYQNS
jgi:hypothetical protein